MDYQCLFFFATFGSEAYKKHDHIWCIWMDIYPSSMDGMWDSSFFFGWGLVIVPGEERGCRQLCAPGNSCCYCSEVVCHELEAAAQNGRVIGVAQEARSILLLIVTTLPPNTFNNTDAWCFVVVFFNDRPFSLNPQWIFRNPQIKILVFRSKLYLQAVWGRHVSMYCDGVIWEPLSSSVSTLQNWCVCGLPCPPGPLLA